MRKSVNLGDNFVEAINFLNDDLVEIFSELRIIETLGQKLRESLNRDEWIANFVRHARGQVRPKGGAIDQVLLLPQIFLRGQIMNDDDSGRNRFQERFGQGFLQCDLVVEKRVLENGGNVLGQDHQPFEITVIKG